MGGGGGERGGRGEGEGWCYAPDKSPYMEIV